MHASAKKAFIESVVQEEQSMKMTRHLRNACCSLFGGVVCEIGQLKINVRMTEEKKRDELNHMNGLVWWA